jgi:hypothetical protein
MFRYRGVTAKSAWTGLVEGGDDCIEVVLEEVSIPIQRHRTEACPSKCVQVSLVCRR